MGNRVYPGPKLHLFCSPLSEKHHYKPKRKQPDNSSASSAQGYHSGKHTSLDYHERFRPEFKVAAKNIGLNISFHYSFPFWGVSCGASQRSLQDLWASALCNYCDWRGFTGAFRKGRKKDGIPRASPRIKLYIHEQVNAELPAMERARALDGGVLAANGGQSFVGLRGLRENLYNLCGIGSTAAGPLRRRLHPLQVHLGGPPCSTSSHSAVLTSDKYE